MQSYIDRPQPSRGFLAVHVLSPLVALCLVPICTAGIVLTDEPSGQPPPPPLLLVLRVAPRLMGGVLLMGVLGALAGIQLRDARSIEYEMTDGALLLKRAGRYRVISLAQITDAQAWPLILDPDGYGNRFRNGVRLTLMLGGRSYVYITPSDPDRFITAFTARKRLGAAPSEPKPS